MKIIPDPDNGDSRLGCALCEGSSENLPERMSLWLVMPAVGSAESVCHVFWCELG